MSKEEQKVCPTCGGAMELEVASYPLGSSFLHERFHVDIYCCTVCRRVNFYAAESEMVTCPVCGSRHSAKEKCPLCAINKAFNGSGD